MLSFSEPQYVYSGTTILQHSKTPSQPTTQAATPVNPTVDDMDPKDTLLKDLQSKLSAVKSVSDLTPFIEKLMTLDDLKKQLASSLDQQGASESKQSDEKEDASAPSSVLQSLSKALQSVEDAEAKKQMNPRKVDDDAKCMPCDDGGGYSAGNTSNGQWAQSSAPSWSTSICYNCNQKGHFARECPMARTNGRGGGSGFGGPRGGTRGGAGGGRRIGARSYNQSVRCYHCGQDGHFARDCPHESNQELNEKCFRCGKTGHWARDCDQPRPPSLSNGFPGTSDQCHRCGKEGHWARDCDLPYQGNQRSTDKCNRCGKEGHWARDCDQPRNDGGQGYGQAQEEY